MDEEQEGKRPDSAVFDIVFKDEDPTDGDSSDEDSTSHEGKALICFKTL